MKTKIFIIFNSILFLVFCFSFFVGMANTTGNNLGYLPIALFGGAGLLCQFCFINKRLLHYIFYINLLLYK